MIDNQEHLIMTAGLFAHNVKSVLQHHPSIVCVCADDDRQGSGGNFGGGNFGACAGRGFQQLISLAWPLRRRGTRR